MAALATALIICFASGACRVGLGSPLGVGFGGGLAASCCPAGTVDASVELGLAWGSREAKLPPPPPPPPPPVPPTSPGATPMSPEGASGGGGLVGGEGNARITGLGGKSPATDPVLPESTPAGGGPVPGSPPGDTGGEPTIVPTAIPP
jgi:hypothetical protein